MTAPRVILANRYFDPDQSATSRLATDLAREIGRQTEVFVLCSRQLLDDAAANLPAREDRGVVKIRRLWSTRWGRRWLPGRALDYLSFLGSVMAWMLLYLRRGDIVIAKTDPPFLGTVAAVAASVRGARLVHWLQDVFPEAAWRLGIGSASSPAGRFLRILRNWALRRATLNVAISRGMAAFLRPQSGRAPYVVIPNWAEDLAATASLRDELGLGDRFIVGYSGNLGRAHPIEPLLALGSAFHDDPAVGFLVSGGGENLQRLKARVRESSARNWTFLPYQPAERLPALLQTADVHLTILDPRLEGLVLPSKLYGVMSAARPVIHLGDPQGEIAGLIEEHRCGWAISPSDPAGLAALIRRLAATPAEAGLAGRNARRAFEALYSRTRALERWREALQGVR